MNWYESVRRRDATENNLIQLQTINNIVLVTRLMVYGGQKSELITGYAP